METRSYLVRALFSFTVLFLLLGLAAPDAAANAKQSILEVNLKNPGTVAQIVFYIYSPDDRLFGSKLADITVRSPAGEKNLFTPGTFAAEETRLSEVTKMTLVPRKVFGPNQNVKFVLTVPGVSGIRILAGEINHNGRKAGAAPTWYNNDGKGPAGTSGTQLTPNPKLPGFTVQTKDADYTAYNEGDLSFGLRNLDFFPNITESQFDSLDLDAVLAAPPDSSLPSLLPGWTNGSFPNLPDPDPGNLFAADGQILDTSGAVVGAFADGVQTVPEPSALIPALFGFAGLLAAGRTRRRYRKGRSGR